MKDTALRVMAMVTFILVSVVAVTWLWKLEEERSQKEADRHVKEVLERIDRRLNAM